MHTKEQLIEHISSIGIEPNDRVLIHSSMKAIGSVEGGVDTVLDAFMKYLSDGLLIFPTHTWQEWNNKDHLFNPETEPSCVGILSEHFRKRKGVIRSWHPTHSVAAMGKEAAEYVKGEEKTHTPCPRNGCWGRLYDIRAKILFLGAPLKTNTYLHSVEEWYDVPDRIAEAATHYHIQVPGLELINCYQNRHHSSLGDVSRYYGKFEEIFMESGIARKGMIGSARSICCDAKDMADLVGKHLERFPELFNDSNPPPPL